MFSRNFYLHILFLFTIFVALINPAAAQMGMRPFAAGIPGLAQMQSISMQRHQARTLMYQEAIEILKKNPAAADLPVCPELSVGATEACIRKSITADSVSPTISTTTQIIKPTDTPTPITGRKIALLFGNNAYIDPIPVLDTPIRDVQKISQVLSEQYGYEIRLFTDAKKIELVAALNQLGEETKTADSVLIFYAGHGYLMESNQMGYWIAVDGSAKTPANWISNNDIAKFLKNIAAHQIILVSDSCFSGSLTREQKITAASNVKNLRDMQSIRSVLVMTSGDEEPVSDEGNEGHSIFAWSLLKGLKTIKGVTPGVELFKSVKKDVVKAFTQQPQYGAVLSAGHSKDGEFYFENN